MEHSVIWDLLGIMCGQCIGVYLEYFAGGVLS